MKIETELVRSARLGDKESFAQVYDQVAMDLYKVALYTLGNAHDAEDVVSETFIEAYKGIKNLRDDSSFKPWIMRILSIRCKRRIGGYVKEKGNIDIEECINAPAEEGDLAGSASERVTAGQPIGTGEADYIPCGDAGVHHPRGVRNAKHPPWDGELQAAPVPHQTA